MNIEQQTSAASLPGSAQSNDQQSDMTPMLATAAIYFCFYDDKFDKTEHPNKLILARTVPTVADVCSTMKALFFQGQDVVLHCTFMSANGGLQEYPENSQNPVPTNDRANVILIKSRYQEGASKITPQSMHVVQFLQQNNLDDIDIITIFQKQKVTLDNMKYIKDTDLQNFGITMWETRMAILEAIQKYYMPIAAPSSEMDSPAVQTSDDEISPPRDSKRRVSTEHNGSKKFKTEKRLQVKDLEVLVNDPIVPVNEGTTVYCENSPIRGVIILNEDDKHVIEWQHNNKKRTGTLSAFFKAVTGSTLQAKDSYSKIFFHDQNIGIRSLADIESFMNEHQRLQ
jgi:hypothetical protein